EPAWKRILITIGLAAVYIFVLMGRLPYMVSTGLYVAGFILAFKGGGIVKSLLIGAVTAVGVWLAFEKIFLVVLP
ncbi:MAG TPA: tripartite tricarboxylate transporter TctB family protein, partial [Bacillota bacterium]|nr:tripartite tricarboxylate transporter TctB family protein [Bacillota bacterium]